MTSGRPIMGLRIEMLLDAEGVFSYRSFTGYEVREKLQPSKIIPMETALNAFNDLFSDVLIEDPSLVEVREIKFTYLLTVDAENKWSLQPVWSIGFGDGGDEDSRGNRRYNWYRYNAYTGELISG